MFSWRTGSLSVVLLWTVGVALTQEEPKKPKRTAEGKAEAGKIRLIRTLEQPGKRIASLSFSADGSRLVTSGGRTVHLWDTATGKELARFGHKGAYAGGIALAPDGRTLAVCFGSWEILLMDAATGRVQHWLPHNHCVRGFAFAPDSKTLISSGGRDNAARLWEVATGQELRRMRLQDPATGKEPDPNRIPLGAEWQTYYGVAFSPDGKTVAVGANDGSIRLCDPATGAETRRLFHEGDRNYEIAYLAFSPDGRFLAAGSMGLTKFAARLWDVTTGKAVREFWLPSLPPASGGREIPDPTPAGAHKLAFSSDGKTLATCRDGTYLWEVATGRLRHQLSCSTDILAFSSTGLLATAGEEYALVNLWDWRDPCLERPGRAGAREFDRLWADLAAEDASAAYRCIAILRALPSQAVEVLAQRLQPVEGVMAAQLDQLIADLDDDNFAVREEAFQRLAALREAARSALQLALGRKLSPEKKARVERLLAQLDEPMTLERLRYLRAVEALEYIGTAEARRVLQKLADGAPGAFETEDARAALKRLDRR